MKVFHSLYTIAMNLTVYPLIVFWTAVVTPLFPICFLLWKIVTKMGTDRIMRQFIWIYGRGWLLIMSPFVRFRREGFKQKKIPPCIMVVNHLSFFDTYCMGLLPVSDVTFAVRSWPFKMPWYSFFMRLAGYLDVEGTDWAEVTQASRGILNKGGYLLFFPEGHRSRTGELQHFYSGAFRLAMEMGVPIVPLCITGTDTLLPPGRFSLRPATVKLRLLDPLHPTEFAGPKGEIMMRNATKKVMAKNIKEMTAN